MDLDNKEIIQNKKTGKIKYFLVLFIFIFMLSLTFSPIKEDKIIHIANNQTFSDVVEALAIENIVSHPELFNLAGKALNIKIKTGDYLFKKSTPFLGVLYQLATQDHKISPIKLTLREGLTNDKMADILSQKLQNFNREVFLEKAKDKEGSLFPDTYFFFPKTTEEEIIKELGNTFEKRIQKLNTQINNSGKSLDDILIMASILEGEANGNKDNKIISGILWKRLKINMPLQVDVDRKTYTEKGLPKKPLNNPGLDSISAALWPEESSYLYYIHDKNGNTYYAKNYEEHKRNINLYLK